MTLEVYLYYVYVYRQFENCKYTWYKSPYQWFPYLCRIFEIIIILEMEADTSSYPAH